MHCENCSQQLFSSPIYFLLFKQYNVIDSIANIDDTYIVTKKIKGPNDLLLLLKAQISEVRLIKWRINQTKRYVNLIRYLSKFSYLTLIHTLSKYEITAE